MKINHLILVLITITLGMSFVQCTLDEGNPGSNDPALTLQVHNDLSLITLEWTPVKVTGFKEYIILQSTTEIPNSPTPPISQDVTVLTRINEVNITSFSTTNTLFTPTTCYKLYCSVDDRFMYSGSVCINPTNTVIPGFFDRADHDAEIPQVAMFDRVNIKLVAFNSLTGLVENSIPESNMSFPQLDLSSYQGNSRLFCFDLSSPQIRRYTFPQLTLQNQKFLSESLIGGLAWKDFVFIMTQNGFAGFQILNGQTLSVIDSKAGLTGNRNLAIFDGDPLIVLEISESILNRYEINAVGKVVNSEQFIVGARQPGTQNTSDTNNEYYIGGRFATIINKNGESIFELAAGNNAFTQLCRLSPDGTEAAIIVNNINVVELQLWDISNLQIASKTQTFNLPNATYADLFYKDNAINVIGVSFNSSAQQTFLLKFPE